MKKPLRQKPPAIKLNWKAYFQGFCEKHGGEPVVYKGRLLFRDGWQYSLVNYEGPEWPPGGDQERLVRVYWARRRRIIQQEVNTLRVTLQNLETMSIARSAPLQRSNVIGYNLMGMAVVDREQPVVPFDEIEARMLLEDLQAQLEECTGHLKEKRHGNQKR